MHRAPIACPAALAVAVALVPAFAAPRPHAEAPDLTTPQSLVVPDLPDEPFNYADPDLPDHFLLDRFPSSLPSQTSVIVTDNTPADNPTTDAGATLGRVLFYDTKLSSTGAVSCASCHVPEAGFSTNTTLAPGVAGFTRRNSMGLANARFNDSGHFFWDERAATLEDQVLMPFQDAVEMGLTLNELVTIVQSQTYYPNLFADAFGDDTVTTDRISKALAQFVRSIVSFTSAYDVGAAQTLSPLDPYPNFTDEENEGKLLFFSPINGVIECSACHITEAFVNPTFAGPGGTPTTTSRNIGLDAVSTDDLGVAETTLNPADEGKFRTPSLRNVAVSGPFMHDGRFTTLEEVVEFYNSGIQPHPNLSVQLKKPDGTPARLELTEQQKAALAAFLRTLTDNAMIADEKFLDPFVTLCSPADLAAPFGTINLDDLGAFVTAFLAADLSADCDGTGVINLDDLDCFVTSFLAGCP